MDTRLLPQRAIALIACLFGALTLAAGGRVLFGADPGYAVFKPLLIFNVLMGLAYLAAGVLAWRGLAAGKRAAGLILLLNAAVLVAVVWLHRSGAGVAIDSVRAMIFRTGVWAVLFAGLFWLHRRSRAPR